MIRVAIISDIHFAGPRERERHDYPYLGIENPLRRFFYRQFRHWIWQRDPFAHNHLLDRFIERCADADVVVANGDYSCDSAGVGLSDSASFESAELCLGRLRKAFGERFHAVMGDHEIGKLMMSSGRGGLRLESLARASEGLGIRPRAGVRPLTQPANESGCNDSGPRQQPRPGARGEDTQAERNQGDTQRHQNVGEACSRRHVDLPPRRGSSRHYLMTAGRRKVIVTRRRC